MSAKLGVLIIPPWLKAMWSYEYQIFIDIISYYQIASFGVHSLNWMNNVAISNVQFIVAMNPGVGWESQHIFTYFHKCAPLLWVCALCVLNPPLDSSLLGGILTQCGIQATSLNITSWCHHFPQEAWFSCETIHKLISSTDLFLDVTEIEWILCLDAVFFCFLWMIMPS